MDVVVAVEEDGRLAGRVEPIGVDERMAGTLDEGRVLEAGGGQFIADEFGGAADVRSVFGRGAYAGDPEECFETFELLRLLVRELHIWVNVSRGLRRLSIVLLPVMRQSNQGTMKCPICGKQVSREDPYLPFCSERCKTIDLGNWASEKYVISTPVQPTTSQDDEE